MKTISAFVLASTMSVMIGCGDGGPTQTTGTSILTPLPPPAPPAAPAAPPSTAPWIGFVGTEADGFVAITTTKEVSATFPMAINDASQVVGSISTAGTAHAFIWSRADGMKDLGVLPGGRTSVATAINSKGQVVGYSDTGDRFHAFIWSAERGMIDLGFLPGCVMSRAYGINSDGEVVGECLVDTASARMRPFLWTESRGMEDLGTLSGDADGGARAINDNHQIVGYSSEQSFYDDIWRAVRWTKVGAVARLDNCATTECSASGTAINNDGDVVGDEFGTAFVWMHGGTSDGLHPFPAGNFSSASDINDAGQIVGYTVPSGVGFPFAAFTWTQDRGMRALAPLPGKTEMHATGINNKGEIVGYSR